jgi:hypothetical protein
MRTLIVCRVSFIDMLPGLIASGVTFDAQEVGNDIHIKFTGGY